MARTCINATCGNARAGEWSGDQCRVCWRALKAGKVLPRCRHLGPPTGEVRECKACTATLQQVPVFACAKHGACTREKPFADIPNCKSCDDYDANVVQVVSEADGIGDHLLAVAAVAGLKRDDPTRTVALVCKCDLGGSNDEWVALLSGPDVVTRTPLDGVRQFRPHSTYAEQNRTRLQKPRWQHYAEACGTTAVRPAVKPLPADAVAWARQFAGHVVLSPYSAWRPAHEPPQNCREWLPPHWLELERLLHAEGVPTVILDDVPARPGRERFAGKQVIGEKPARVAALLAASRGLAGNDSGMGHVAGAFGVQTLVLCGQVRGDRVFGLWPSVRVLQGPLPCSGCHWQGRYGWQPVCDHVCASLQLITPAQVLAEVERWLCPEAGLSLLSPHRLDTLRAAARETADLPGDVAELGVYRGGSALCLARELAGRRLHLFDTWAGLPEDDTAPGGRHVRGEFAGDLASVREVLSGYPVEYHVGRFPGTTAGLDDLRFGLVHVDGDLLETTRAAVAWFWPRLVPGGIMVFDDVDWGHCPGVNQALAEAGLYDRVERTAPLQGLLRKPRGGRALAGDARVHLHLTTRGGEQHVLGPMAGTVSEQVARVLGASPAVGTLYRHDGEGNVTVDRGRVNGGGG